MIAHFARRIVPAGTSLRHSRRKARPLQASRRNLLLTVALMVSVSGCKNPFVTRTPEPPDNAGGNHWLPPFASEVVLENLRNAITDQNVENYLRCFSDSTRTGQRFRFKPETAVANQNPGLFSHWGLAAERDYFVQLRAALPADSARSLLLDSLQTISYGDSALFVRSYVLVARHKRQSIGVPGRVAGELRFWLIKDQFGEWSIYRWADFSTGPAPTWSSLKAAFVR
ncbi:MAG: hypothetical protein ONB48_12140 [candidate division KSB1 bacterium]|nr:hypothetical protein [candidate division KSB1 bacterium]MDZ7274022.1 hypothetical protein [candidate division KSB1 bacterium]MDZ7286395.1 hypothetical protein [candidate division KSB1 bacterium]MDZ7296623.1 hypothetical protein [candidate division KSB1 bacterium]MDZ7306845.1 hypothetical protein [candidate division KSB1 bacterium]